MTAGIAALNQPGTLAKRANAALRQAIRDQILTHGRLYSEQELAESLGISRTPVREALIELAREGLVEIVRQRGFRLRELGPDEQREVFQLRLVLESFVVRRLAEQADPGHVRALRKVVTRQAKSVAEPVMFRTVDEELHLLMAELAGLHRTHEMLVTLRGAMWLIDGSALRIPERMTDILAEHGAVIEAIERGDPEKAEAAIRVHIDGTAQAAAAAFES